MNHSYNITWTLLFLLSIGIPNTENIHISTDDIFGQKEIESTETGVVDVIYRGDKRALKFDGNKERAYMRYRSKHIDNATKSCFNGLSRCKEFYVGFMVKLEFSLTSNSSKAFLRHGPSKNNKKGLSVRSYDISTIQIIYNDGKETKFTNILIIKERWNLMKILFKDAVLRVEANGVTSVAKGRINEFQDLDVSEESLVLGFEDLSPGEFVEISDYKFSIDPDISYQNDAAQEAKRSANERYMAYSGQNYIKYSFANKIMRQSGNEELSLEFKFLDDLSNGLIWYAEKGFEKSYIYLKDSKLYYVYTYRKNEGSAVLTAFEEIHVPQTLAPNIYHKLVIQRTSDRLTLTINEILKANKAIIVGRVPLIPPEGEVYIGGHYDPKIVTDGKINDRFRGQIKQIIVSGDQRENLDFIDMLKAEEWKNKVTVVGNVEISGGGREIEYTGDYLVSAKAVPFTFTEFDKLVRFSPWDFDQFESIEIQFKTREPRGVLLFVGPESAHTDYVCLEFFDMNFYLAFNIDAKDYRIQLNPKGSSVTTGKFHTVFIKRDRNHKFTAKFDNNEVNLGSQGGHQKAFSSYTYIGGIDSASRLPWHTWSREGFVGCINYIRVNEDKYIDPRGKNNQYSGDITGVDIGKCLNDVKQCTASLCEGGACIDRTFPYLSDKNYFCDCSSVSKNYRNPVGNIERGEICARESETLVGDGSSFYVVDFKNEDSKDKMMKTHWDDIAISFKTTQSDGTIFRTFRSNSNLYFSAVLRGGYVEIETNINDKDGAGTVQTFRVPRGGFNDNQWHTVYIRRRADNLMAYVDNLNNNVEGKIPVLKYGRTFDNTFEFIFVGSSTSETKKDKFVGSMRNFFWNQFDLLGTQRLPGTYRGSLKTPKPELPPLPPYPRDPPVKCTMSHQHRYTKVSDVPASESEPGFYVEFITQYNGVIWHAYDVRGPSERYLTILIIDNQLILVYRMNEDSGVQIIDDGSQISASDNVWHRIFLMLHKKLHRLTVQIDNAPQPRLFYLAVSNAIEISKMDFYFGGMPDALYNYVFTQLRVTLPRFAERIAQYKDWSLVGCIGEFLVSEDKFISNRFSSASVTHPLNSLDCGGCRSPMKCDANYCHNKGYCHQTSISSLSCNCSLTGFSGERCEKIESRCPLNHCMNGGQCYMSGNTPRCECSGTGYRGDRCGQSHCSESFCYNNGVCDIVNRVPTCNCRSTLHTGRLCEKPICQEGICNNRGQCFVENEEPKCDCTATGFVGKKCETEICSLNFCFNGGRCVPRDNKPACECPTEYSGIRCEEKVCALDFCFNGGQCHIYNNSPRCRCHPNFEGERCQIPKSCPIDYCLYGSLCRMSGGRPYCDCRNTDHEGDRCNVPKKCPDGFCLNGGSCIVRNSNFLCQCQMGFKGPQCQDRNECPTNYCMNKGVCSTMNNVFKCDCIRTGYTGDRCDTKTIGIVNEYDKYGHILYYIIPPKPTTEDSVSIGFQTYMPKGTLYTFITTDGKYWALKMENGKLVIDVNGNIHRTQSVVNDGQYYVVNLERRGNVVYVSLSGPQQESTNIDFSTLINNRDNIITFQKIVIGANKDEKDHFKGVLGGFNWNGQYILRDVKEGRGERKGSIIITVVPTIISRPPTACPDNYCRNNGLCVMVDYLPFCRCEHTGYFGLYCEEKTYGFLPQKNTYGGYMIVNFVPPRPTNKDDMQLLMQAYQSENPVARFELTDGNYYEIKMIGGQLFLVDNRNTLRLISDSKRMDNGLPYLIKFERERDDIVFYINGQRTASFKLLNLVGDNGYMTHKRVVLGADITLKTFFQGALGGFKWNGAQIINNKGIIEANVIKKGNIDIILMPNLNWTVTPPVREKKPLPDLVPMGNHGGVVWNRLGSIFIPGVGAGGGAIVPFGMGPVVLGAGSFLVLVSPLIGGLLLATLLFLSALIWACWRCKPGCCPCCAGLAHGAPTAAAIKQKIMTPIQLASMSTGGGAKTGEKNFWSKMKSSFGTPIVHDGGGFKKENVALLSGANGNGRMAGDQGDFHSTARREEKVNINHAMGGSLHSLPGGPLLYSGSSNIRTARSVTGASPYGQNYGHGNMLDVNDYRFGTVGQGSIMRIDTTHHDGDFDAHPNVFAGEEMKVDCCVLSQNSRYAVTGSASGPPQIWDMQSGELYKVMDGMELGCTDLHLACGDKVLIGLVVDDMLSEAADQQSRLKRLQMWDFASGSPMSMPIDVMCSASCITHAGDHLIINRETNDGGMSILCWDMRSNQPVQEISYHQPDFMNHEGVNFLKISHNDRMVVSGFTGVDDQAHYMVFDRMASYPRGVVVQPLISSFNAKTAATEVTGADEAITGTKKGELIVWNLRTGKSVRQILVNASLDGHNQTKLNPHKDAINCVVMSKNGEFLVTGSTDQTVNVYTLADEKLMHSLEGHADDVLSVAISLDNEIIVSGSWDGSMRVWNLESGAQMCWFTSNIEILSVKLTNDKKAIVALGERMGLRKLIMLQIIRNRTRRTRHTGGSLGSPPLLA